MVIRRRRRLHTCTSIPNHPIAALYALMPIHRVDAVLARCAATGTCGQTSTIN